MIYLITGVTSFLGLELCNQLLELGHTVYGVCRESSSNCSSLPRTSRFIPIFAQMSEFEHLILPTDIDVFIHLAWAGTNHAGRDLVNIHEQNIAHTFDAMRMAAKFNCKLFIDAGSQAEYGYHPEMITEHSSCNPTSEYGKAKLKVYQAGSLLCKSLGLKYIHLRIFSLIGESDHPWTLVMTAVDRMRKDEPLELSSCEQ
ncbi:MAG: NAD-dependent epimerase/dehydratase family protein, partial [Phocaeicola sp.]